MIFDLRPQIFAGLLLLLSTVLVAQTKCGYVSAREGLNVRSEPSTESRIEQTLNFGARVQYKLDPKLPDWAIIEELWRNDSVYVSLDYIPGHMEQVPKSSLYYYRSLRNKQWFLIYNSERQKHCRAYYEPNTTEYRIDSQVHYGLEIPPEEKEKLLDIRSRIALEIVDIGRYADQGIKHPFEIARTYQGKPVVPNSMSGDFYLSFDEGADSLHVKDYEGEGYISKQYLGEIHALNAYVVEERYEESSTFLVDRSTGETQGFSVGIPNISPDGKRMISFDHPATYNRDDVCRVSISGIKGEQDAYPSLIIEFKSWQVEAKDRSGFWVSDREIIVRIFPVDQLFGTASQSGKRTYEYLKITLL